MNIKPPVAKKVETILEAHSDKRIDNYFWMNQRDSYDVISYLEQENKYFEQVTSCYGDFENSLFVEMKNRIKEDDESVPFKENGYWYIKRFNCGGQYPIFSRKKDSLESDEEILFDVNEMAKGHKFYKLNEFEVSPDNKKVAFTIDTKGRRMYSLFIKDIETGVMYKEEIKNVNDICWADDNLTIFYSVENSRTLRSEKVMKHILGTDPKQDKVVYFEKDNLYDVSVYKTKSDKYIFISSESSTTSQLFFIESSKPNSEFRLFEKKMQGVEYSVEHYGDNFYILHNAGGATNFQLDKTPISNTSIDFWVNIIPHREDTLIEDIDIFKDFLVVSERSDGLCRIRIKSWDNRQDYYLPFDSETYTAFTSVNLGFDTDFLRYSYTSLKTPYSIIDFNMRTREKEVKKQQVVFDGNFDTENYTEKRIWAKASDGKLVPISLVYKNGIELNGKNPLLLYGYGSYGISSEPCFSSTRLSLLNRGFIYAIAHVRGGEDLGRQWYQDGKMLNKKNTFTDFISCAKHLIDCGYTSSSHLYAMGGSAGGLLMGVVINMAGELFNGVVAQVPFVDTLTTMLDEDIPLTTGEYEEWGNPNQEIYYTYIKSYSPYDNVTAKNYPNLMVTTGYHDSQVQYWEPAKWVALLREKKTDENLIVFHTNMSAGHSGASGRFESLREVAREFAFILYLEGMAH